MRGVEISRVPSAGWAVWPSATTCLGRAYLQLTEGQRSQIGGETSRYWDNLSLMPAVDPRAFRDVCGRFATGVSVVTSFGPEGPSGMTANAVASLSLDPPLFIVCFDRGSRTLAAVEHSRRFGVSFLARDQEQMAAIFASKRPEAEKFEATEWDERSRIPAPTGCVGGLACELRELIPGGDHLIGVGDVVDVWSGPGEPLVFHAGSYWHLRERETAPAEVDRALEGP